MTKNKKDFRFMEDKRQKFISFRKNNLNWGEMKDVNVDYTNNLVTTSDGVLIMASWEAPMMELHAEIVCRKGGDILEIGFGLGISASYIQTHNINSHTIIEPHPEIAKKAREWSQKMKNVKIIESDWFDVIDKLEMYDGVFYDAEFDKNMYEFYDLIKPKIKKGGIYSFFNPEGDGVQNFQLIKDNVKYKQIHVDHPPYNTLENQYMKSNIYYAAFIDHE